MKLKENIQKKGPEPGDSGLMDILLKIGSGSNFENVGVLNRINPMIQIKAGSGDGNLTQKTTPKFNEPNPVWNENFVFMKVSNSPSSFVEFKAFHFEKVKEPALLGTKRLFLRDYLDQQRREITITFDNSHGETLKVGTSG